MPRDIDPDMNSIDRPALRVSSHQRRAAALARFVRRHGLLAEARAHERDGQTRAAHRTPMTIELLLRDEDE